MIVEMDRANAYFGIRAFANPILGHPRSSTEWKHARSQISSNNPNILPPLILKSVINPSLFFVEPIGYFAGNIENSQMFGGPLQVSPEPEDFTYHFLFCPICEGTNDFVITTSDNVNVGFLTLGHVSVRSAVTSKNNTKCFSTHLTAISKQFTLAELTHLCDGWEVLSIKFSSKNVTVLSGGTSFAVNFESSFLWCLPEDINMKTLQSAIINRDVMYGNPTAVVVPGNPPPKVLYGSTPPTYLGSYNGASLPLALSKEDWEKINKENEKLVSNQGRSTCFKCGGLTKKVDSGMFSVWDICPKCGV